MRVERVGRNLDGVEGEVDAFGLAERLDPGMDLAEPFLAAELAQHVCACGPCLRPEWSGRAGTAASAPRRRCRGTAAIALSSRFWPMKHQGQTTSETTSIGDGYCRHGVLLSRRGQSRRRATMSAIGSPTKAIDFRPLDAFPVRDPLLRLEIERNDVCATQEHAVVGAHRRRRIRRRLRALITAVDHGVDGRVGDAGIVEGARLVARRRAPAATCSTPGESEGV